MEIIAYKTSDGKLFEDERLAKKHQENLLGEALDDLLPNDDRGNVTRTDRFNLLMKMMEDEALVSKINELYHIVNYDA